jgi:hypothetical protein
MKLKEEKVELEKLLNSTSGNTLNNNSPSTDDIPELEAIPITDCNFTELKELCEHEAEIMINNSIRFIIPLELFENNEYLKNKLFIDIMSLGGMIYQVRTNEVMQKALIDQLNAGMVNARMFEVFSAMSKTIAELNKQLLLTVEAIKESYKTSKRDIIEINAELMSAPADNTIKLTEKTNSNMTADGGQVSFGSKDMIKQARIRAVEASTTPEDTKFEEIK